MDETSSRLSEPLLSTFLSNNDNSNSNDNHLNENGTDRQEQSLSEEQVEVLRNKTLVYGLFGRPYALYWNFWWQHLISAVCLGAFVGCLVGVVLWTHQIISGFLFPTRSYNHETMTANLDDNSHQRHRGLGQWWWILIPPGGALLSSIVLELPRAPKPESFRSLIHDLASLDANFVESFHALVSSWFALIVGLPIGVDLVVGSIGSGCAKIIADVFQVDARTRALYIQAGLSAAMSILLPSPILGMLLVQELSVTTRSGTLMLSSVALHQSTTRYLACTNNVVQIDGTLADHDIMEQVLIGSISVSSCTAVLILLFSHSAVDAMRLQRYTLPESDVETGDKAYLLHWLLAIPIGLLCGAVVTLSGAMYLKWSWSRAKGCAFLMQNERLKFTRARQVFAVFAGLVCGVLGFVWSYPVLFDNGVNAWQNVLDAKTEGVSAFEILHFGLHVMIGVAICIGCGILGGCTFPMLSVGACLGAGISCHLFPMALSVPCCMAGCISGFLPAPFTIVLTVSMLFDLDANQSTSVLLSVMASYTVTGGSGMIRRLCACAWTMSIEEEVEIAFSAEDEEEDLTPRDVEIQEERPLADYEIRQEIQSKIFGNPSTEEED
ncbi:voltage gated chloride channel [Nitzschia inconspicua]|uniref:Voltage gated chloride channel n=1 Tax=Nitzschia inconspicua TaxID=303405 RepID=A0A9K3PTL7_9STRA|nr:voltage gated chloride channel [Nitzschia inconspicua]